MVYGIRLLQAFMGHILMDEMPIWWFDGHIDVLGRLLHKFLRTSPHMDLSCGGECGDKSILGRSIVE